MAKLSTASIRLVQKLNRKNKYDEFPIYLVVCWKGRKEKSTGVSCKVKYWDSKREIIKASCPNAPVLNKMLSEAKNSVIQKRNEYDYQGKLYTASMLLESDVVPTVKSNDLKTLIQQYIDEKGLESKTIEKWWIVYRNIKRFIGRDVIVDEINESFCRRYGRWMESEGLTAGSIRSYLGKVAAICNYAIAKSLMKSDDYPFKNWKYHLDYRESKNELYIHSRSMEVMMEMFFDEVVERTGGKRWSYRDGVEEELVDLHSELYGHYLYVIGYYMCGLAPSDISFLKKKDIKVIQLKDKNVYAIDGHREKTGQPYKIRILKNTFESNVLINSMLMFNDGEYFLPTLKGYAGKDMKKRVNNLYTYHGDHLVAWFQKVNEEIARRNVENGDNIPLIDLECRYYSYRHSFIMKEIQKKDVNLLRIATLTGKAVSSLHQYITLLDDVDLI